MKFILHKYTLTIFLLSCFWACNNNSIIKVDNVLLKKSESSELKGEDLNTKVLSKETPFVTRPFQPYLDSKWIGNAISYGCFREGQAPGIVGPNEEEILEDLNIISQYWNLIRVYGADDDSERILKVIKQYRLPIRLMLGIWLEKEIDNPERRIENQFQVDRAIELANSYPDIISAINVGNETQVFWSWHRMQSNNLIKYIRTVRTRTSVPVTTADDYNFWNKQESKEVAQEIDFIVLHAYPLWNGKTIKTAIPWLDSVYTDIMENHPKMDIILGEIGWATNYNPVKDGPGEQGSLIKGEVSVKAQEKFLFEVNNWINKKQVTTFLFEAFDEPWKGGGSSSSPDEVEKHWGVFYEDRNPKESFINYLFKNK